MELATLPAILERPRTPKRKLEDTDFDQPTMRTNPARAAKSATEALHVEMNAENETDQMSEPGTLLVGGSSNTVAPGLVECPSCGSYMKMEVMNVHLDRCLDETFPVPRAAPSALKYVLVEVLC
jgi:hypothetical protein